MRLSFPCYPPELPRPVIFRSPRVAVSERLHGDLTEVYFIVTVAVWEAHPSDSFLIKSHFKAASTVTVIPLPRTEAVFRVVNKCCLSEREGDTPEGVEYKAQVNRLEGGDETFYSAEDGGVDLINVAI